MEYGGFPQESLPTMQGGKELSSEYLCLENAALAPRVMNVMPGEDGYPAEIEITLPASMTADPLRFQRGGGRGRQRGRHQNLAV